MNAANNPGTQMAGLLMTRPGEGNARFLAQLPQELLLRLTVIESPLMKIIEEPVDPDLSEITAVIFTSQQAVKVASAKTHSRLRAFCVGARTSDLARELGWDAQMLGRDSGEFLRSLLSRLAGFPQNSRLIHLRGEESRGQIAQTVSAAGLSCREQVIYRQEMVGFSAAANRVIEGGMPLIVPLFSPRTARHFAHLLPHMQHLTLILLSDAVAAPFERLHCEARHVSKTPDARGMAQTLVNVARSAPWVERLRSAD